MLVDSLVQLIGMIPYVVGLVLFVIGAPDSSYDEYSTFAEAPPVADTGNTAMMVAGGLLVVILAFWVLRNVPGWTWLSPA
jgi:hypothetical protein